MFWCCFVSDSTNETNETSNSHTHTLAIKSPPRITHIRHTSSLHTRSQSYFPSFFIFVPPLRWIVCNTTIRHSSVRNTQQHTRHKRLNQRLHTLTHMQPLLLSLCQATGMRIVLTRVRRRYRNSSVGWRACVNSERIERGEQQSLKHTRAWAILCFFLCFLFFLRSVPVSFV